MKVSKKLGDNLRAIKEKVGGPKTFDFINRDFKVGDKDATLFFIDSLSNGELLNRLLDSLMKTKAEDLSVDAIKKILDNELPWIEVTTVDKIDDLIDQVLAGPQALLIEGEDKAIIIDARTWLSRTPEEPELEKSTRGPGIGFVETMVFNIQMIRRHIRDPKLRTEALQAGNRSKNDISVVYIEDIASSGLVEEVKSRIEKIETDGLPLADRTVEDFLTGDTLNPLPKVRYTNRPDVVVSHVLEGKICILVDNSPTALILPATFFDHTQSLEDYRQSPITGTYLNCLRLIAILLSLFLVPIWLLIAQHPEWLPQVLEFIGPKEVGKIPLGTQFILATIGIDLLRTASIQTPSSLATSLGLIGALVLGEFSVKVGLFNTETIFYMAIAAISSFSIPGFELSMAIKLFRLVLIILVVLFKLSGLIGGSVFIFTIFAFSKSFGIPYLWPLIPFNWKALKSYLIRQSVLTLDARRPKINKGEDNSRK